ncbi:ferredoxin--NADP reductase [Zoogloea sp.]|uniref:ferredoxin--NADP reductase n=1 Tax=Zoogloea sp. TaxID=49181 RepID=UPI0035B100B7
MDATPPRFTLETLTHLRRWTPRLFSFRMTRPAHFHFRPGQFARLGLDGEDGQTFWRPYSMVSTPDDPELEFLSIVVPGGAFTSRLETLRVGDTIRFNTLSFGFLTTDTFDSGTTLWMLATGTGLAPFVSLLRDPATWRQFPRLVLVHGVRHGAELAYRDELLRLVDEAPVPGGGSLRYLSAVTRESVSGALSARIPTLLASGDLQQAAGWPLDREVSRIMICGNPDMVQDTRSWLTAQGFRPHRRKEPGQFLVELGW